MTRFLLALLLLAPAAACSKTETEIAKLKCPNYDALDRAALKYVVQSVGGYPVNDALFEATQEQVDTQRTKIAALGAWAKKLPNQCERAVYDEWVWFYNYELDDVQREITTHKKQRDFEAWQARNGDEVKATEEAAKSITRPPQ